MTAGLGKNVSPGEKALSAVVSAFRELHNFVRQQPVVELANVTGRVAFPLVVRTNMQRPRVVSLTARRHPDDGTQQFVTGVHWRHDAANAELVITGISGLTSGQSYQLDFAIFGESV